MRHLGPTPPFRPIVFGIIIFLKRLFQIVLAVASIIPQHNPFKSVTRVLFADATVDGKAVFVTSVRGTLVASTGRARNLGTASVMKDGEAYFATRI